jgi:nitric oxide synthase-interacting protein
LDWTNKILICSKDGFLFDKEAILTYIIEKKNEYNRKMKEYERQKKMEEEQQQEKDNDELQKKLQKFIATEKKVVSLPSSSSAKGTSILILY